MTQSPRVTLVIPAFNAEAFIQESVRSALRQTYVNLEVLVVDDGSTDRTFELVEREQERETRLRLVSSGGRLGVAAARNIGLDAARGEFIAWLDADDIARCDRIARQIHVLDAHPEVGICGSWARTFGWAGKATWRYPRKSENTQSHLLFDAPLATSSVTMRRNVAEGGALRFNEQFSVAEDYDYWERASLQWRIVNIPRVLMEYRIHAAQTSSAFTEKAQVAVQDIQGRQLERLGITPTAEDWETHSLLGTRWGRGADPSSLRLIDAWLERILRQNTRAKIYPQRSLERIAVQRRRLVENAISPSLRRRAAMKLHTALC